MYLRKGDRLGVGDEYEQWNLNPLQQTQTVTSQPRQ